LLGSSKDGQCKTNAEQQPGEHSCFNDRGILLGFKDTNANAERNASTRLFLIRHFLFMVEL
jgi:hypothetical protein